jgi:cytosine/uracil/thiamine/allantoin permease
MEVLSGYYLNLNNMLMQKIQLITQQQTEYLEVLFALNFAAVIAALIPAVVLVAGPQPTVSTVINSFWVRVTMAILASSLILYLVIPRIRRLSQRE